MKLTGVSLFAGVGGFDLAMERNGIEVVASVEIDKHARSVLSQRFPNSKLFNDVKEVTGNDLRDAGFIPEHGIITGGFPCQDLSVAGKRLGFTGQRSSLFYEIARLADETKAKWLILENVPGLLTSQRGADMGAVIGTLVELGYGVAWRVLDAQHFGVPQRRRRVFIVAERAGDPTGPAKVLFEPTSLRGDSPSSGTSWEETAGGTGQSVESAGTLTAAGIRCDLNRATNGHLAIQPVETSEPIPIHDQATRFAGKRGDLSDGKGNGLGVGNPGDPMNTLTQGDRHAVFEPTVFVKPKRAQSDQDDETWKEDGPHPTVNQFDVGDSRTVATVIEPTVYGQTGFSRYTENQVTTLTATDHKRPEANVAVAQSVRRLTPMECERLQGFPDNWTEGQADSHRYKQMGNAVAVPVVQWILRNLVEVEAK